MIERVARAICLAGCVPEGVRTDCDTLCCMCLDEAKAAIEAMRVPTKWMVKSCYGTVWPYLIDKVLEE